MAPTTPNPRGQSSSSTSGAELRAYWDEATKAFVAGEAGRLWRRFCDELHRRLIERWIGARRFQRVLKTDLFDEAADDGLVPVLAALAGEVHGVDVSSAVAAAARHRGRGLRACVADARAVCYRPGTFDLVVSNSTLDHFPDRRDILTGLREIHRVMAPGGTLLVSLDNPLNPVIGLRGVVPFDLLKRARLVPYFVGATMALRRLCRELEREGFEVLERATLMHVPRLPAMLACRLVETLRRLGLERRMLSVLAAFEALGSLPTRELTAHFVVVLARKRSHAARGCCATR